MNRFVMTALGLMLGALPLVAGAQTGEQSDRQVATNTPGEPDDRPYLNLMPYLFIPDEDRGTDHESMGAAVGLGWHWRNGIDVELQLFGTVIETDAGAFTDFYQGGGGIDLRYRFLRDRQVTPFILGGIGAVHNDVIPDSEDDTSFFANVGLGFVTSDIADLGLRVRGEARYIYDDFEYEAFGFGPNSGMGDIRVSLGIEIPLGSKVVEREVVREVVREKVVEVPAKITDSDGDGVPDQNDRCPDTLRGLRVDNRGCAEKNQTLRLEGVNFELDSARLTLNAREVLDRVVRTLQGQPTLRVEIAGHTDSTGSASYNQRLSQERAASVRSYLVSAGIESFRLVARGYGETQPIASNETDYGRARNRRVEFRTIQ